MPPVRTAYRVGGLPPETKLENVSQYLAWDPDQNVELIPRSLGSINDHDAQDPKVATVYFNFRDRRGDELPSLKGRNGAVVDKKFIDFTPLNAPEKPIIADIIAVTGLAGNAFGSWASDVEHMWLRDMLANDFRNARILIYGYDSRLQNSSSFSVLSGLGHTLANGLGRIRRHDPQRPLILIGHSLGGLIIEKALLQLNRINICPPISLLIFLGVPHRGIDNKAWKKLVTGNPTEDLVNQMGFGSSTLTDIRAEFSSFLIRQQIPIFSVFEQKLTKSLIEVNGSWERDGDAIVMVPEDSAVLDIGDQETRIPSQTDHSQLAKLTRGTESIYPQIKAGIETVLGRTPGMHQQLMQAIKDHDLDKVTALVSSNNLDLNGRDDNGDIPISLVAKWSSKDAMKLLLQFGADPNRPDGANWTALTRAAKQPAASLDVVVLLLEHHASIDLPGGPYGCSALHCAASSPANFKVVEKLLELGANAEVKDRLGRTALYIASRQNCHTNVNVLLNNRRIDVNSSNWNDTDGNHGETPLMGAAYCDGESQNNGEVLKLLVNHGANVNAITTLQGQSALMIASSEGNCQGVHYLLDNGAKTDLRNKDGYTALICAAKAGRLDVTRKLVAQGKADFTAECNGHWRAVDWAHHHGHVNVVEYLLATDRNYRPKSRFADDVGMNKRGEINELLQKTVAPTVPRTGGILNYLKLGNGQGG